MLPTTSAAAAAGAATAERPRRASAARFIRDILLIFLAAILISFLIKTFLFRSFYIPSDSMINTLVQDDKVIVNELVPDLIPVEHGDVIVFTDPGGWLPPPPPDLRNPFLIGVDAVLGFIGLAAPDSHDHLIKRVIGLPGDTVACCNDFGQLTVNGIPLEEPYIRLPDDVTNASPEAFEVTVPEGSLWVLGDNRYNSGDSARHRDDPTGGFVPIDNVVGRAILISWPIDRWTWLDNYPVTFHGVEGR